MAYAYTIDAAVPTDTDLVSKGAEAIRDFKNAVLERILTIISSGGINTDPWVITPRSNLTPGTNNTYDLGVTGTRWKNGWLSGTLTVAGAVAFAAGLTISAGTLAAQAVTTTTLAASGAATVACAGANAFTVGLNGATNPALTVDTSVPLSVTGLKITSQASGGGGDLTLIGGGTDESFRIDSKGAGSISLNVTGTGDIRLKRTTTFSATIQSTTAVATPGALAATQYTQFASTASGASIMGFGTTNDVSLMNRAGTVVLGVGPNTTVVNIPGTLTVAGLITGSISGNAGTATSATTAGTVTTAAQPAITSVGTLTSLDTSGTIMVTTTGPILAFKSTDNSTAALQFLASSGVVAAGIVYNYAGMGIITITSGSVVLGGGLAISGATAPSHGIQFGTSAPGVLANGQLWYDGTDPKFRKAGATVTVVTS